MMWLISDTIETSVQSKNDQLRPLYFKLERFVLMDKIVGFLNANNYIVGEVSKEFSEIYAMDKIREYTFSFVQDHSNHPNCLFLRQEFLKKQLFCLLKSLKKILRTICNYYALLISWPFRFS